MKLRTAFGVCIALVLTLLIVSAQSAAVSYSVPSIKVISAFPEEVFEVGDEVTFKVHVFEKGERVNADNITVFIGDYWGREVNATPTATAGIYEVTFTINESDVDHYGNVDIRIMVEVGSVHSGNSFSFEVAEGGEDEIDVGIEPTSSTLLRPGETFKCDIMVKKNDEPADYNDTESDIWITGPGDFQEDLNGTRVQKGKYRISLLIPANLSNFGSFYVYARLLVGNDTGWGYAYFMVIDIQVWYEKIDENDTSLVARFWVNDLDGEPVDGADVDLEYDHDNEWETPDIERSGTTTNGSVKFTLPHANLTGIYIEMIVKIESQTYSIWISINWETDEEEEPDPEQDDFDVIPEDTSYTIGSHEYEFTAYNDTEPWASDWVYYYFGLYGSPAHKILVFGKVKTDSNGKFSVTFNVPSGDYTVIGFIQAAVDDTEWEHMSNDGREYHEVSIYLYQSTEAMKSSSVKISAAKAITLGEDNLLDITIPGEMGILRVLIVPVDAVVDIEEEMAPALLWALIYLEDTPLLSGSQKITLMLPSFLPEDQKFVFVALSISEEGVKYNYLMLKVGQSGGTGDDGGDEDNWFPGFGGITVAAALGVALVAMRRKRR